MLKHYQLNCPAWNVSAQILFKLGQVIKLSSCQVIVTQKIMFYSGQHQPYREMVSLQSRRMTLLYVLYINNFFHLWHMKEKGYLISTYHNLKQFRTLINRWESQFCWDNLNVSEENFVRHEVGWSAQFCVVSCESHDLQYGYLRS